MKVLLGLAVGASAYSRSGVRRYAEPPTTTTETALDEITEMETAPAEASPLTTLPTRTGSKAKLPTLNGWVPRMDSFCYGLPGAILPMGEWDPVGFSRKGVPLNDVRRYREAEVMHGRVAMTAAVGYLVGEWASPVVWAGKVSGPANDQLEQIPGPLFALLTLLIGVAETIRARRGWVEPAPNDLFELRSSYYPGDLGFDPLNLKPTDADEFATMQSKELSHGRLAMIGVAGMCAQELVNHKTIFETYQFYSNYINDGSY